MKILLKTVLLAIWISIFTQFVLAQPFADKPFLKTTGYKLDIKFDFKKKILVGECLLEIVNRNEKPIDSIPLLLYRLMKIHSITDEEGHPMPFNQSVRMFEDWSFYQANFIKVAMNKPIKNGEKKKLKIKYSGHLLGYAETGLNYLKDRIDPEFTIIRPDSLGYPKVGYPSFGANSSAGLDSFDYEVRVTVPSDLIVANGGKLIRKTTKNDLTTYIYKNIRPAWRIDFAVAKYSVINDGNFSIYHFPKDSAGANQVAKSLKATFDLYTNWWGKLENDSRFSLIEIPKGYGSQADVTAILQTADAFSNLKEMGQLYHEISHIWNVDLNDKPSPRWNEGLAMFIQHLTVEKLEKRQVLDKKTSESFNYLKDKFKKSEKLVKTPMIDFGKEGITSYSYTVGMLMFRILHELVGEEYFHKIIGSFYKKYKQTGATTKDFIEEANKISQIDLTKFFDDWMFTTAYTKFIKQDKPLKEIVAVYE